MCLPCFLFNPNQSTWYQNKGPWGPMGSIRRLHDFRTLYGHDSYEFFKRHCMVTVFSSCV